MKNNMKLIMESWRKGLQENNAKQSDGGEILTPSEMQEVEKILKLKVEPELKKIQQTMMKKLKANKDKIKQLEENGEIEKLNEEIFSSIWATLQTGALIASLAQMIAGAASSIAIKFGRTPFVDPENQDDKYWNEMHMKVHKAIDHFKRTIASYGFYPLIKLVIEKFVTNPDTKKRLNRANEILADVMAFAAIGVAIFNKWEAFKKALQNQKIIEMFKTAFGANDTWDAVGGFIDNANGLKDYLIIIFKKLFAQST